MRSLFIRPLLSLAAAAALIGNTPAEVDGPIVGGEDARGFASAKGDAETDAAELFRAGAEKGDAYSQWRLAVMIDEGTAQGTLEEAVALFRKAAGQKSSDAMVGLAVMHATGRGTARDHAAAMRYYQAAARMGNAHGLQGIGVLYANGEGVAQDLDEALAYWLVASAAGDENAQVLLLEHMPQSGNDISDETLVRADRIARNYNVPARFEMASGNGF
ncbi:tetratricopeptide repeat protein [Qipengyuania sp. MTN3-11]|uniref:tetratricopeptide repeat protein n=1 Tax=Qipengyuania sp. MTN3-11 TaxID=3056557 RepID=UPI0036F3A91B